MFQKHIVLVCIYSLLFSAGCKTIEPTTNNLSGSASRSSKKSLSKEQRLNRMAHNIVLHSLGTPNSMVRVEYRDEDTGLLHQVSGKEYSSAILEKIKESRSGHYIVTASESSAYLTLKPSFSIEKKSVSLLITEKKKQDDSEIDRHVVKFKLDSLKTKADFEKQILQVSRKMQSVFSSYVKYSVEDPSSITENEYVKVLQSDLIGVAIGVTMLAVSILVMSVLGNALGAAEEVMAGYAGFFLLFCVSCAGVYLFKKASKIYRERKPIRNYDKIYNSIKADYEFLRF